MEQGSQEGRLFLAVGRSVGAEDVVEPHVWFGLGFGVEPGRPRILRLRTHGGMRRPRARFTTGTDYATFDQARRSAVSGPGGVALPSGLLARDDLVEPLG